MSTGTRGPLRTRLCEDYGCDLPIAAFSLSKEVVAAASAAGGVGVLGASTHSPEEMRVDLRWIKEHVGDRPFGVNMTVPASVVEGSTEDLEARIPREHRNFIARLMAEHGIPDPLPPGEGEPPPPGLHRIGMWRLNSLGEAREKLDIVIEERVPIFVSGLGSPAFVLDELHAAGTRVWGLIGTPRQAQRELEQGLDLIIAQGADAGGHSGQIGTFSLVAEVVELAQDFDCPVLAAGGVATGRHIAAAIALGADGVWTGTIWSAVTEATTDPYLKRKVIEARNQDAWSSRAYTGKYSRRLRDPLVDAWE